MRSSKSFSVELKSRKGNTNNRNPQLTRPDIWRGIHCIHLVTVQVSMTMPQTELCDSPTLFKCVALLKIFSMISRGVLSSYPKQNLLICLPLKT